MSRSCPGTKAHLSPSPFQDILNEPEEIISVKGATIPRKLSVDYISFSAHVDFSQNSEFIEAVKAPHIVGLILGALRIGRSSMLIYFVGIGPWRSIQHVPPA